MPDNLKDNRKGEELSRFFSTQHTRTDPFGNNRAAERLYQRAERLAVALHLLTKHISEDEPLRREIRARSIGMLERVLDIRDEMRSVDSEAIILFQASIRGMISLVRMCCAAGFISLQNAEVVIAALDELGFFIASSQRTPLAESIALSIHDLEGETGPLQRGVLIKDIKDTRYVKDSMSIKDVHNVSITSSETAAARAAGILSILQVGSDVGIKDIAARLPDYSEKMIQRELALLIKGGKVKKIGSKRWSRYILA